MTFIKKHKDTIIGSVTLLAIMATWVMAMANDFAEFY